MFPIWGSPPFVLMTVSGKALAAGSGRTHNPRLAPCGSLITSFNKHGGEPEKDYFKRLFIPSPAASPIRK